MSMNSDNTERTEVLPGSGAFNKQAARARISAQRAAATKLRREEAAKAKAAAKTARRAAWLAKLAARREAREAKKRLT